jgi:hypothetical protein
LIHHVANMVTSIGATQSVIDEISAMVDPTPGEFMRAGTDLRRAAMETTDAMNKQIDEAIARGDSVLPSEFTTEQWTRTVRRLKSQLNLIGSRFGTRVLVKPEELQAKVQQAQAHLDQLADAFTDKGVRGMIGG